MAELSISEAITLLRQELIKAQREAKGSDLHFLVREAQVELSITVKKGTEAGGGIKAWVVDTSIKGTSTDETGHKLVLTLEPQDPNHGSIYTSSDHLEPEDAAPNAGTQLEPE